MTEQLTFFESYFDAIEDFDDADRLALYDGLMRYVFRGEEPEFGGFKATAWKLIKPNVDKSLKRSRTNRDNAAKATGKATGKATARATEKATVSLGKDKEKDKDRDKEKDMDLDSAGARYAADALEAFNEESGKDVRQLSGTEFAFLASMRENGRTVEDIRRVVRTKRRQWEGDPRMARYLRPSTIFKNFEDYVNEQEVTERESDFSDAVRPGDDAAF